MQGDYDYVFFLGDGLRDFDWLDEELYNIVKVAGNCDYFSTEAKVRVEVVEGIRILITHGDIFNVRVGNFALLKEAREKNIDIVCFGHSHNQVNETEDGIMLLNPGALKNGNYMVLELIDKQNIKVLKF